MATSSESIAPIPVRSFGVMATSSESIAPIPVHWFLITVPLLWAEIWEEEGGLPLHALLRVCTVKDLVSDAQKIGKTGISEVRYIVSMVNKTLHI